MKILLLLLLTLSSVHSATWHGVEVETDANAHSVGVRELYYGRDGIDNSWRNKPNRRYYNRIYDKGVSSGGGATTRLMRNVWVRAINILRSDTSYAKIRMIHRGRSSYTGGAIYVETGANPSNANLLPFHRYYGGLYILEDSSDADDYEGYWVLKHSYSESIVPPTPTLDPLQGSLSLPKPLKEGKTTYTNYIKLDVDFTTAGSGGIKEFSQ